MSTIVVTVPDHTEMIELRRAMPDHTFIVARTGLYKIGAQRAYWSVTGEVYDPHSGAAAAAKYAHDDARGLTDHERGARALNVAPAELPEGLTHDAFAAFTESLRPRWKAESLAAYALLQTLKADQEA